MFLERLALWLVGGSLTLLPVFFIPALSTPFQFTKTLFATVAALIAVVLVATARLSAGSISIPRSILLGSIWLLPIAYLLSSAFSSNIKESLFGQSLDVDTFAFVLLGVLITSLAAFLFRKTDQMFAFYLGILGIFVLLTLFHAARLIGGVEFLSFGVLTESTANVLGKWNDLGIFFGLVAIFALIAIERFSLSYAARVASYLVVALSLFFLTLVNLTPVWVVLALSALGFIFHNLMRRVWGGEAPSPRHFGTSAASFLIVVVSVIFLFGGGTIKHSVANLFDVSYAEVRPSWQSTIAVGREVFLESPLFGSGPNTFATEWARYRPAGISATAFWNTDFTLGVGVIPTSLITGGLAVGLAWMLFLTSFLVVGIRTIIAGTAKDRMGHYVALSSFLGALYLWILSILYTPNAVILLLAFFLTGIFIASLRSQGSLGELNVVFDENPRTGRVLSFVLALCIAGSILGLYVVLERYAGAIFYRNAVLALDVAGDLDAAERDVLRAVRFTRDGSTYRLAANILTLRLSEIAASNEVPTEEVRTTFQEVLASAIEYGKGAARVDSENYQSWVALGGIYHAVTPLGIQGAYEGARSAYERAATLAPSNPNILLVLAQLEASRGATQAAREYLARAIQMKSDYAEAVFFLSQLEARDGNIERAIASAEAASSLAPSNSAILFQVGFLKHNASDSAGAITPLERAVELSPGYANARYFLGLAYYRTGRVTDSIAQFESILALNPGNREVEVILSNLRTGRDPLTGSRETASVVGGRGLFMEE